MSGVSSIQKEEAGYCLAIQTVKIKTNRRFNKSIMGLNEKKCGIELSDVF